MKVTEFRIEESAINKGAFILIAKTEDGKEWGCSWISMTLAYLDHLNIIGDPKLPKSKTE